MKDIQTAQRALDRLKTGNAHYLTARQNPGDISPALRRQTCAEGQAPYAVIVTCADSRVVPEAIFSAGLGELFVIRVAGNVIAQHELGSIQYAAEHLGTPLVVVMGHTHCGAVGAAIQGPQQGPVESITWQIRQAIGAETDDYKACCLNVRGGVATIQKELPLPGVRVCGAVYHIEDGRVEFL